MIRYFLAKGDKAGEAVIIEGLPTSTYEGEDGFISPSGPRLPDRAENGQQHALSGDINVCDCKPAPVFFAIRNMTETITSEDIARMSGAFESISEAENVNVDEDLEHFFEIVDAMTEQPVQGMTYKLTSEERCLVHDAPLSAGRTRPYSLKDHPNLKFVAWREGEKR